MRKQKIILTVAAALGLVLLCASLPKLTAMFIDGQAGNSPVYNDIRPVEMELQDGKDTLPILGKLYLCANGKNMSIEPFHAQKTEDEIIACVDALMDACQEAGFYQSFTPSDEVLSTKLVYDVGDPSNSIIVWTYFAFKSDPMETLEIMIDDETGKIFSITYRHPGTWTLDGIWERNKKILDSFTDLYFAQLGLSGNAEAAEAAPGTLYEYAEVDFGVTEVYYTLSDPTYGTVQITFNAGGGGTFLVQI